MAKKSANVPAAFVATVAAYLVAQGCSSNVIEVRRCVDADGRILPDEYCEYPYMYHSGGGGYVYVGHPSYVYGGSGGYSVGGKAWGYSVRPSEGATITSRSGSTIGTVSGGSISRGGFGRSASGSRGSFGG
jgi:hypothetical protein